MFRRLMAMTLCCMLIFSPTIRGEALAADVQGTHWAYEALGKAESCGWLEAAPAQFRPDAEATLESVGPMMIGAWPQALANGKVTRSLKTTGADAEGLRNVPGLTDSQRVLLAQAMANGLLAADSAGTLATGRGMTRAEMALLLAHDRKLPAGDQKAFADEQTYPLGTADAIHQMVGEGIMSLGPDGTFQPNRVVTRAEAVVTLLRWAGIAIPEKPAQKVQGSFAEELLRLVNAERGRRGLCPLSWDPLAYQLADERAVSMGQTLQYCHLPQEQMMAGLNRHGISGWKNYGENLIKASPSLTPQKALNSWLGSTAHHQILLGDYNHAGIGFAQGRDGYVYLTMEFIKY